MPPKALAIANNDLVYLWWTYPEKIPECLGFTIHRLVAGKDPEPLPAFVGFTHVEGAPPAHERSDTDHSPIQSYQWKDLFVPEEVEVSYEITPVKGTPGSKLEPIDGLSVTTKPTKATDTFGRHRVVFNRGIISTQAVAGKLPKDSGGGPSAAELHKHIEAEGDPIREALAGEAPGALMSLLERARAEGGRCHCALYELTDTQLIDALKAAKGHVEVILSNADSSVTGPDGKDHKVYDGTNHDTRQKLHEFLGNDFHDRLLQKNGFIGHNKFVVYLDPSGTAKAVVTGSTNWTPTGLCAQSNNILVLEDETIAKRYFEYWKSLLADDAKQSPELRIGDAKTPPDMNLAANDPAQGHTRIWFSPNTPQKTKPAHDPPAPPDMAEVFDAIDKSQDGVLFLLFSAGSPSILQHIAEVEKQRATEGRRFFVRGAISDATASNEFATSVYNDSILEHPNELITGIGGVPDTFAHWEKELAKLGHAVIHDKVLVVDPFSDGCVVVNGSHNLGYKASYSNDENLCLMRGNRPIAESFAAHVLDVVNHYNWRYKLTKAAQSGTPVQHVFEDLDHTPAWQDKYFTGNFLASRDLFFFPPDRPPDG